VIWVREDEVGMPSGGVVVLLAATSFQVVVCISDMMISFSGFAETRLRSSPKRVSNKYLRPQ
jgi:hypothetical protein